MMINRKLPTIIAVVVLLAQFPIAAEEPEPNAKADSLQTTPDVARRQARLLYEAFHGTLQVMHRDFFEPEDRDRIPSASLEDVFSVMAKEHGVSIRWMGVNATKDKDHEPRDEFEKAAAKRLAKGDAEYEAIEKGVYRYVGSIQLHNSCLKCHVPYRTTLEDRFAGLAISIPLGAHPTKTKPK